MNHRYNQALAEAVENKEELKNIPEQANDLGGQTIALMWQSYISNEPVQEDKNETNQKELFMSLIRSSSRLLSGQRFSVHDPRDS